MAAVASTELMEGDTVAVVMAVAMSPSCWAATVGGEDRRRMGGRIVGEVDVVADSAVRPPTMWGVESRAVVRWL